MTLRLLAVCGAVNGTATELAYNVAEITIHLNQAYLRRCQRQKQQRKEAHRLSRCTYQG